MGEDAPLELRPGCIHQAWDQAFTCLLPTLALDDPRSLVDRREPEADRRSDPERRGSRGTGLVDFHAEAWTVWRVDPKPQHPRRPIDQPAT